MNAKANVLLTAALATVLTTFSATSRAGDEPGSRECSPKMLRGLYLFRATGFVLPNGTLLPKAILESIRFNGDGSLVAETVTLTVAGQAPVRRSGTAGTYTVEANCTGTVT